MFIPLKFPFLSQIWPTFA